MLYEAVAAEGDFYLFPSADMSGNMSEADFDTLANYNRDHPNRLYVEGKPLVTVYSGDNVHDWTRIVSELQPVYFVPYWPASGESVTALRTLIQDHPYIDGLWCFGGWAWLDDTENGTERNANYADACAAEGKEAMVSAAPCFNRHSGLTQIENRILGNDEGFRA